jgi:hypothetical protein
MFLAGTHCSKCGGPATIVPFLGADGGETSEVVQHNGCPDAECETPDDPPTISLIEIEVVPNGEPITYRAETHPACWDRFERSRGTDDEPPAHDWQRDLQLDEEALGPDDG